MIGPGTSVAPFVGFAEHRLLEEKRRQEEEQSACPTDGVWRCGFSLEELALDDEMGETGTNEESPPEQPFLWLVTGCRHERKDYLYRAELESFASQGVLSKLTCAFSRDQPHKVYVQHKLLEHSKLVADSILCKKAYVFVCGDGAKMAGGVHETLVRILQMHGGMSQDEASEMMRVLSKRGRYVRDIWS